MDPVRKAIWFVESHSRGALNLEDVAKACSVSQYHLTRAFAATTGLSLMRYVRGRKLSRAAKQLAAGFQDILRLALESGYGSHEAFTRAFREQFGLTPEQLRSRGNWNDLELVEEMIVNADSISQVSEPRFETIQPRLLAGIVERYPCSSPQGIPDQWQRFQTYLGKLSGQIGLLAYGASFNFDSESNFDYMCGVEVKNDSDLPGGLKTLALGRQLYAVFQHKGHVAGIRSTFSAIWSQWFPQSGRRPVEAPTLEIYGPEFNPRTGMGGFEIWIAIQE